MVTTLGARTLLLALFCLSILTSFLQAEDKVAGPKSAEAKELYCGVAKRAKSRLDAIKKARTERIREARQVVKNFLDKERVPADIHHEPWSKLDVALRVLGEVRAKSEIPLLLEAAWISIFYDAAVQYELRYPATGSLVKMGLDSVEPILEKLASTKEMLAQQEKIFFFTIFLVYGKDTEMLQLTFQRAVSKEKGERKKRLETALKRGMDTSWFKAFAKAK